MGGVRLDLPAQAADVDHQGVLIPHKGPLPEGVAQGVHGDDVAPGLPQLLQQRELLGGQGGLHAVAAHEALAPVDLRVPEPRRVRRFAVDPPQHGAQPEQQLLGQEGLCDVVVRPEAQPAEPVRVLVPGGEEQHRHVPALAQLPEQGEPVPVREVHVQQHRVRVPDAEPLHGLRAGEGGVRLIPRLGQDLPNHVLQCVFVVHDQNAIGHTGPPFFVLPFIIANSLLSSRPQRRSKENVRWASGGCKAGVLSLQA